MLLHPLPGPAFSHPVPAPVAFANSAYTASEQVPSARHCAKLLLFIIS